MKFPAIKTRPFLLLAALSVVGGAVVLSACSDEAATLAIQLEPTALSVAKDASGTFAVNIDRGGSFSGQVSLVASGGPEEIAVTFNPTPVTGSAHASTGTVTVSADATTGSYPITITASGDGVPNATATLTVTVPETVTLP
jgi:uncharacterized membrane protein